VADIRAVGPGVWNSWKGQLMRTLYSRVEALFRGEDLEAIDPQGALMAEHAALVARAGATGAAAEALARPAESRESATEIALAARDRPGLFADLAAVLAAAGADVAGARVATAADGTVLDVFQVQDGAHMPFGQAEPRRLRTLIAALEAAARGETPVALPAMPAASRRRAVFDVRPVVMIDPAASATATVIEVSGADRPGLLAELARTLSDHALSIRSAHVAGFGERAVDSFYVTDADGRKIADEGRLDAVHAALEAVLDRAPATPQGRHLTAARASARDVSDLNRPLRRAKAVSPDGEAR
jgi:[protein-PII] uridylyltransferase